MHSKDQSGGALGRTALMAAAILLAGVCNGAAQEGLSEEEKARLAASDAVPGKEVVLPEIFLPFHDPFEGTKLIDQWQVVGENKDKYLPEKGAVFVIQNGGTVHPANANSENIFALTGFVPDVDFDMSLKAKLEAKTGYESLWVGLRDDENNYLAANLEVYSKGCGASLYLRIENRRVITDGQKPETTKFSSNLLDGPIISNICSKAPRAYADIILASLKDNNVTLTLSRRGMRYFAKLDIDVPASGDNPGGPKTLTTMAVSRVLPFGQPFFMLGQASKAKNGETTALFDDFSIVATE